MSRKNTIKKRPIICDVQYDSQLVSMLINRILKKGKKSLATKICYQAMQTVQEKTDTAALDVLQRSISNLTPTVEVKSKRVGGSTYQVPHEVTEIRGQTLALCWLIQSANTRSERGMVLRLANEIIDASNETGSAFRKREETHRIAAANKAFAHYRF